MNKLFQFLIGPELLWMVFYVLVGIVIKVSHSPIKSMDSFWLSMVHIVPFILIPLTFILYFIP